MDDQRRIDDPAFADVIEREVLEPYAEVQRKVADLKMHPDADSEFVAQISRFTALRAEGWRLLIGAQREQDREKLRRYEQKMDEAVAIAGGLLEESGYGPASRQEPRRGLRAKTKLGE